MRDWIMLSDAKRPYVNTNTHFALKSEEENETKTPSHHYMLCASVNFHLIAAR